MTDFTYKIIFSFTIGQINDLLLFFIWSKLEVANAKYHTTNILMTRITYVVKQLL